MKLLLVIVLSILATVATNIVSYQEGYKAGLTVPRKPTFRGQIFHDNSMWACKHTHIVGVKCYKYAGDTK
jgi:hypothetical protein